MKDLRVKTRSNRGSLIIFMFEMSNFQINYNLSITLLNVPVKNKPFIFPDYFKCNTAPNCHS